MPPVSVTLWMSSNTARISFPVSALSSRNSAKLRDMIFQSKGLQGDGTYINWRLATKCLRDECPSGLVCDTLF